MKSPYPFIFFFGLLSLTPFFVLAQCSFNANYSAILYAETYKKPNGDKVLIKRVAEVDEAFCFSKAVNEMPDFFSYLKTHFTEPQAYQEIDLALDSIELNLAYRQAIEKDSVLIQQLDRYAQKTFVNSPKDSVSLNELMDVAAKFFAIKGINEKGFYVAKVCVGINLIESTLKPRRPFLEAFAFAAILDNLKYGDGQLMSEFTETVKGLYTLNLGIDQEERLLRAQGATLALMKQNASLQESLTKYYRAKAISLPFQIIEFE